MVPVAQPVHKIDAKLITKAEKTETVASPRQRPLSPIAVEAKSQSQSQSPASPSSESKAPLQQLSSWLAAKIAILRERNAVKDHKPDSVDGKESILDAWALVIDRWQMSEFTVWCKSQTRALVRADGCPSALRGKIWPLLCGSDELLNKNVGVFDDLLKRECDLMAVFGVCAAVCCCRG